MIIQRFSTKELTIHFSPIGSLLIDSLGKQGHRDEDLSKIASMYMKVLQVAEKVLFLIIFCGHLKVTPIQEKDNVSKFIGI